MRLWLVVLLVMVPAPVWAQDPPTVTPTWVQSPDPQHERACYQAVPCEATPPPCTSPPTVSPCAAQPRQIVPVHYEMRSKPLFWAGLGVAAAGVTLAIGAMTWAEESEATSVAAAPCGTDPALTRFPVAPCKVSNPLLIGGVSLIGSGTSMMLIGGSRVAIGTGGRDVVVRVKF